LIQSACRGRAAEDIWRGECEARPFSRISVVLVSSLAVVVIASGLSQATTVTVTNVSPGTMGTTHFPQNKQNESPMAVNPLDPMNAITGANDEIQEPDCTPATGGSSSCPFVPGVDNTGVYVNYGRRRQLDAADPRLVPELGDRL
jgi:hypothetical protein